MKKSIEQTPGTIAYHFTKNKDKLWACGDDVESMRKVALELLEDSSLTDKIAVAEAKMNLRKTKPNLFYSILMTYMTGLKVTL